MIKAPSQPSCTPVHTSLGALGDHQMGAASPNDRQALIISELTAPTASGEASAFASKDHYANATESGEKIAFACVIACQAAACVSLYLATGVLGYQAFGPRVSGDVLIEFSFDNTVA